MKSLLITKTIFLLVLLAIIFFLNSCSSVSPCYSISQGKGMPTPISKGKELAWEVKFSKTPYYNKPKKQSNKKSRNLYETKWYEKWL
jgi:hypothetical protein